MTTVDRIQRALNQRLYLIDRDNTGFLVQGSRGTSYNVVANLDNEEGVLEYSCACMDHAIRKNICKHIVFVLMRVMQVDYNILQGYFNISQTQLRNVHQYRERQRPSSKPVEVKREPTVEKRKIEKDTECPICFELLNEKDKLVWCQHGCGNSIHLGCFNQWSNSLTRQRKKVTCVLCRNIWC